MVAADARTNASAAKRIVFFIRNFNLVVKELCAFLAGAQGVNGVNSRSYNRELNRRS